MWTVDALMASIGVKDKAAATKALATWLDLGVLKLTDAQTELYQLLEVAEARSDRKGKVGTRQPGKLSVVGKHYIVYLTRIYSSYGFGRAARRRCCTAATSRANDGSLEGLLSHHLRVSKVRSTHGSRGSLSRGC
jgi:hypothetical protein